MPRDDRYELELRLEKNKLATALQLVPMSDEQRARVTDRLVELMSVRLENRAAMLRSSEALYRAQATPRQYAHASDLVEICLQLGQRPCAGGDCDDGRPCPRHGRRLAVAERYLRMKEKERR